MTTPPPPAPATITIPRALFIFSIFYGGMVCIAGVLGNKQVAIGPLAVDRRARTRLLGLRPQGG